MSMVDERDDDLELVDVTRLNPAWTFVLDDVPQPGPWYRSGACRTAPTSLFFLEVGESAEPARRICACCAVRDACLDYALDAGHDLKGFWGGMSERQRHPLITARRAAAAVEIPAPINLETERAQRRPAAPAGQLYSLLEKLAEHPERWARVDTYTSRNSAAAVASLLRNGHRRHPDGRWQFEGRTNDAGGSDLYALYEGPAS